MGCSLVKLPQAYWAKSTQGSAVVSMKRVSRPGGSGGFGEEAGWVWAVSGVHRVERSMSAIATHTAGRAVIGCSFALLGCGAVAGNSLLLTATGHSTQDVGR